jgi:hypothetical protein
MAKVLFENKWYEEVAPSGVYESVYEAMIKAHAEQLWPRFHPVHFKASVYAGVAGVRADLVLIERNYSEWWVVEVEMSHHSLSSHVLPQTRKLASASYLNEAEKLCEGCSKLELSKVKKLLKENQPGVLVIVNKPCPEWVKPLEKFGAMVAVFEVFKSDDDEHLFRVNGEHPVGSAEVISLCRFDALMNRWLLVENPISLRVRNQTAFPIEFDGHTTIWAKYVATGKVWLHTPNGPNPLPDKFDYELVRRGDGQLAFNKIRKKGIT